MKYLIESQSGNGQWVKTWWTNVDGSAGENPPVPSPNKRHALERLRVARELYPQKKYRVVVMTK